MAVNDTPTRRRVIIVDVLGFSLRSAAMFAALTRTARSDIGVTCKDNKADGKSILDLAALAAGFGMMLDIEAHGPDAGDAVAGLADSLASTIGPRPLRG